MNITTTMRNVGFYAGRLRKEKISKFLILTTACLALVLQLTAGVLPFSANEAYAATVNDADNIIYQGVDNKADMLAIYDRGVDNAGHKDIQQIYTQFGVTRQDIANSTMGSYKTNDFGGKLNTLSRVNWSNSGRSAVTITATGSTIYTGPFLSGANSQPYVQKALIGKRSIDGQWFAITLDCGNIVYITPPTPPTPPKPTPKPAAACVSLTIEKISRTGMNLIAKGAASNGATIKAYHYVVAKDGKVLTDRVIPTTGLGSQINQGYETGTYTAKVSVQTSLGELTSENCKKTFTIPPAPAVPVYTCDSLSVTKVNRTNVKFDTKYTVKDATFKSVTYVITDASGKEVARTTNPSYTQTKEGAYSVRAIVTVTVNGVDKTAPDNNCKKSFTVEKVPVTPVYTCDSLTVTKVSRTDVKATGVATATGGASIVNYTFTFGDGSTKTVTNPTDVAHSYAKAGTYTVKLAVTVKVDGKTKTITDDTKCVAKVTISPPEVVTVKVCDLTTKQIITIDEKDFDSKKHSKDVNDCKEIVVCELATYTEITIKEADFDSAKHSKDLAECVKPVTPPELPKTGAGSTAGSILGLGSVIASLGYYISSRRGLLGALLNR